MLGRSLLFEQSSQGIIGLGCIEAAHVSFGCGEIAMPEDILYRRTFSTRLEKAREFDPFGHAGFDPTGIIRLTP